MDIASGIIGVVIAAYSVIILLKTKREKPIGVFKFEDGSNFFLVESPGYYSISILGASNIYERTKKILIELVQNGDHPIKVKKNLLSIKFKKDGKVGAEIWGFTVSDPGGCVLSLGNLQDLGIESSILLTKELFQDPIEPAMLKILIYRSVRPVVKLIAIISLVLGIYLSMYGIPALIEIFK